MKLTYRGQAYKIPDSTQAGSNSTSQPKIKLIYRGHTYDYVPRPVVVPEAVAADKTAVTLIYRGNTYERKLQLTNPYQHRAINWRYQSN